MGMVKMYKQSQLELTGGTMPGGAIPGGAIPGGIAIPGGTIIPGGGGGGLNLSRSR